MKTLTLTSILLALALLAASARSPVMVNRMIKHDESGLIFKENKLTGQGQNYSNPTIYTSGCKCRG